MESEVEGKTKSLEWQYVALLEKRVAQLQSLVDSSSSNEKTASGEGIDSKDDKSGTSAPKTPLTKDNLDKMANGSVKDGENPQKNVERVRQVIGKLNEKTGLVEDIPIDKIKEEGAKSGCILRNVLKSHHEIELGQGPLLDLLKEVMVDNNADQTWTGEQVNLRSPFTSLVHKWDLLKKVATVDDSDSSERNEARADLSKVLDFVQHSTGLEAYFKDRESHRSSQVVEYKFLWTIFPSGTEVIASTFMEEQQVMIVSAPPYLYDPQDKSQQLVCWYYDHDGTNWIVAQRIFEIDRYHGTRNINTLSCYPLEYHKPDRDNTSLEDLKLKFTKRGERFKELCTAKPGVGQSFDYNGHLLSAESGFRSQYNNDNTDEQNQSSINHDAHTVAFKKISADGSIQVDPKSYLEQAPLGGEDMWLGEEELYLTQIKEKRFEISEEKKFLLAPPRVLGWSSKHKYWCQFLIDEVKQARKANDYIFDHELQLEPEVKKMIKALVTQHNSQKGGKGVQNPDLIEGKGRGLVIMLHGPPGVGKTLTAEAIAEKTSRPLLIVSVAQIGLNASKAERNLERMFQLASRWEAILLVDEADVFLETRDTQANPNRNALVSVLLRVLEYYEGIIILTTNRIKSLDSAVQSRIHLAVRFEDLTQTQMQSILVTILQKFSVRESAIERITESFKDYLADSPRFKLNGREIRNVVFSAHAMAMSEGKESMGWAHIGDVLRVTRKFQDELKSITDKQRYNREAAKDAE